MAIKIPVYQAQQVPNTLLQIASNPQANAVAPSDAVGRGMLALSKGFADVSDALQRKDDMDSMVRAGKVASDASVHWSQYFNEKANKAEDGAPGFTGNILEEFDKYREETLNNEPNSRAKLLLTRQLDGLRNTLAGRSIEFEAKAGVAYRGNQLDNIYQNWSRLVASGDMTYESARENMNTVIANMGFDPITRNDLAKKYGEQLAGVKLTGQTERNPNGVVSALQSPYGLKGFGGASEFVLKQEGGYGTDSNGFPVNMGINAKYHKGIDVKGLTRDQALEIYKTKYWDKIGGDELSAQNPALALAAFDTAIMAGPDQAKKLIKQSGGDANKFIELREQFLSGLVAADKDGSKGWKKSEQVWNNRNQALRVAVASAAAADADTAAAVRNLPIDKVPGYLNAAQGEQKRQNDAQLADVSIQNARMVIDQYPQTADIGVDLVKAKADAVRMTEQRFGPLSEVQRLNVEGQVERMAGDRTRALRSTSDSYLQGMFDQLDSNNGDLLALRKDPIIQRKIDFLSRADRDRLEKYAGEVATGGTRLTDWTAYNEIMENPAVLKTMNLDAMKDKFNRDVLNQLKKVQGQLANGEANEQNLVENHTAVKRLLDQAGIKDKKKQGEFDVVLQGAIDTQLQVTGKKKLTQQEILGLANDLLVKKITDRGIIWNSTERAYKVEVPAAERVKITAALRANGLPETEYLIQQQYLKKLDTKK